MTSQRKGGALIAIVLVGLVAASACIRSDGSREAAWAVLANDGRPSPPRALLPGEDGTGRVPATTVRVSLGGCEPRAQTFTPGGCFFSLTGQDELGLHVDEDDATDLTASATLTFHGEHRTASGEVTTPTTTTNTTTTTTPTTAPSPTPPAHDAAAAFTLPPTLAGLQGSPTLFQREGENAIDFQARQQAEMDFLDSIAGRLSLRELVVSRYIGGAQDHIILGVHPPHNVILYAGRRIEPTADTEIGESADALLAAAFEATFVAERDDAQVTYSPVRRHDTGSPAVQVGCAIRTVTAQAVTLQHPVCGWVEQHTIGLIQGTTIVDGVEPTAEHAESQTARLVTAMRAGLAPTP